MLNRLAARLHHPGTSLLLALVTLGHLAGCGGDGGGTGGAGGAGSTTSSGTGGTTSSASSSGTGGATSSASSSGTGGDGGATSTSSSSSSSSGLPVGPWAQDRAYPWTAGGCTQWTRNPPQLDYLPPLPTTEAVWAPGSLDVSIYGNYLMRKGPSGWRMDATPTDLALPIHTLLGDDTILFALVGTPGTPTSLEAHARIDGVWSNITDPSVFLTDIATRADQTLLVVGKAPGDVFQYDGSWTHLPAGSWTMAHAIWGGPSDLYVAHTQGLQHFDGAAWTEIAPSFPTLDIVGVGGTSPTDVYAVTKTTVYRVDSGMLTSIPGGSLPAGACGSSTPGYGPILAAGSNLIFTDDCSDGNGKARRLWRRESGGFTVLPDLPAAAANGIAPTRVRALPDGSVTLSTGSNGADTGLHRLVGSVWSLYPIETPEPVQGDPIVIGGDPIYAANFPTAALGQTFTLTRLVAGEWQVFTGVPTVVQSASLRRFWRAPDGVLFVASRQGQGAVALHRFDGTTWTLDDDTHVIDPVAFTGRTSSDVMLLGRDGTLLRWDGSSWATGPAAPVPAGKQLSGGALAGTSRIVSAYALSASMNQLLELDGTSWSATGTSPGSCCTQLGDTAPQALVSLPNNGVAVRDQAGWSMFTMTLPSNKTLLTLAGPSPSQLFGRFGTGTSLVPYDLGSSDSTHVWTIIGSDTQILKGSTRGQIGMWTDGAKIALESGFGGYRVGPQSFGGEGLTVCDVAP